MLKWDFKGMVQPQMSAPQVTHEMDSLNVQLLWRKNTQEGKTRKN